MKYTYHCSKKTRIAYALSSARAHFVSLEFFFSSLHHSMCFKYQVMFSYGTEKDIIAFVEATKGWSWGYGTHSDRPEFLEKILRVVPRSKKIAVLGIHHPAIIPVLVSMGIDITATGAHARYAQRELYITDASIRPLPEMQNLPCSCPACINRGPDDLIRNGELLKEHNLTTFITEVKRTINAIYEGRLYEYARRRAMTHPDIYKRFKYVVRSEWVLENTPFPKQSSLYVFDGDERPEIIIGRKLAGERGANVKDLAYTYPFGQTYPPLIEERPEPEAVVRSSHPVMLDAIHTYPT